jgi:hypothetical protein
MNPHPSIVSFRQVRRFMEQDRLELSIFQTQAGRQQDAALLCEHGRWGIDFIAFSNVDSTQSMPCKETLGAAILMLRGVG